MNRICRRCGAEEDIRFNFGEDREAEAEFHNQDWCNCNKEKDE